MTPTTRANLVIGLALAAAGLALAYRPLLTWLRSLVDPCAADLGGPNQTTWCSVVLRYPNRLPFLLLLVLALVLVCLGRPLAHWCLRPVTALVEVVERMGPASLGYRLGWQRRQDVVGRLGIELDTMMDRIASGYDSQRRFAANASHELRTPLAVQRTLIEVGMSGPLTTDRRELLTEQLLSTNQRNEHLIEGLLALSEAEQTAVRRTPQQLDQIALAVVQTYRERAGGARVTLTCTTVPTLVAGEHVLLEHLVTNLVQNAILYNRIGGSVDVRVGQRALTVANDGPVVPAEDVDGLFEPFRRGTGDRLVNGAGAGLGLTICRAVATAHGAAIVATPRPDGGLEIRVEFPN